MLTVRLSAEEEKELDEFCQEKQLSKSQVVKKALSAYIKDHAASISPYEAGVDLFGQQGSGETDRSVAYKKRVKSMLDEKYPR